MSLGTQYWLAKLSGTINIDDDIDLKRFEATNYAEIEHFIYLCIRHNVHLLVWKNLISLLGENPAAFFYGSVAEIDKVAASLISDLRERRLKEVAHNMLIATFSRQIMERLQDLPANLVKGLDFAENAYGGIENRKFGDIDILVSPKHVSEVGIVLTRLGFSFIEPKGKKLAQTERQWVLNYGNNSTILAEVHTDLVHDPKLRRKMSLDRDLFAAAENGGVTNASRMVLAALHGATSHLFGRLQYVLDGLMIGRSGVDPDELRHRAARSGATLPVATMLRLAEEIYQCECTRSLHVAFGLPPFSAFERRLISPELVLSAKNRDRWRYLPQRYIYRSMLAL